MKDENLENKRIILFVICIQVLITKNLNCPTIKKNKFQNEDATKIYRRTVRLSLT